MRDESPLTMRVSGYNRGGLLLSFYSLQGFLPVTQMLDPPEKIDELSGHVGRKLLVQIIELNREKKRLLVSERVAHIPPEARVSALSLTPGTVLEGTVSSVHFFGAFVDLGDGKEGLVHVSELDWKRVGHPQEVLEPGQQVRVVVMNVDHARRQVILSLKRMRPDPWATASRRYHPGQVLEGVVTGIAPFGAFVRLESGIEGLVHNSEMSEGAAEIYGVEVEGKLKELQKLQQKLCQKNPKHYH
jgi:small subunit ribosomal protein S1